MPQPDDPHIAIILSRHPNPANGNPPATRLDILATGLPLGSSLDLVLDGLVRETFDADAGGTVNDSYNINQGMPGQHDRDALKEVEGSYRKRFYPITNNRLLKTTYGRPPDDHTIALVMRTI